MSCLTRETTASDKEIVSESVATILPRRASLAAARAALTTGTPATCGTALYRTRCRGTSKILSPAVSQRWSRADLHTEGGVKNRRRCHHPPNLPPRILIVKIDAGRTADCEYVKDIRKSAWALQTGACLWLACLKLTSNMRRLKILRPHNTKLGSSTLQVVLTLQAEHRNAVTWCSALHHASRS
jgi:hypothetical protein